MQSRFPLRFFIVTFLWSWLSWLPLVLIGQGLVPGGPELLALVTVPGSILAAFGPAVGALVSLRTLEGRGAAGRFLKTFLSLRFGWKVWAGIFAVLGLTTAAAWALPELWGEPRLAMLLPSVWVYPAYWLLMVFLGGGQEEIGWRGYIRPRLEARFGPWGGSLVLAAVWALWHLPLWFIPGTSQTFVHFFAFFLLLTGYSFFFSWVLRAAGNRPLAGLVAHGTGNSLVPLFPVLVLAPGTAQPRYWLWAVLTLAAGAAVLAWTGKKKASGA